jgi:hypothetical protein
MENSEACVVLIVGHRESAKGAKNPNHPHLNEFDINKPLAVKISRKLIDLGQPNIVVLNGSVNDKIKKINKFNPEESLGFTPSSTIQVSLHFNAYKGYTSNSSGCEVLISEDKDNSARLADLLMKEFSQIGNPYRGIKPTSKGDRGYAILSKTKADFSVLCEPLFIDSEEGEMLEDPTVIEFLSECYVNGILNFIKEL